MVLVKGFSFYQVLHIIWPVSHQCECRILSHKFHCLVIDMKSLKLSGMFLRGTLRGILLVMKSDSAGRVNLLANEA